MPTTEASIKNFDNEEDEQSNNNNFQVDDVIAIKNTMHGFRIAKVHTVNNMDLHVHLYFYQLDDKSSEVVFQRDLLINFGRIGTKKKVQLTGQHQKDYWENYLKSTIEELESKLNKLQLELNRISSMENQLQQLLKSIVIDQNHDLLIKQICESEIMNNSELLNYVFNHLNEIPSEEKLTNLGQSMSRIYVGKKDLDDIREKYENLERIDPWYDTKKRMIKTIVVGIGELINEDQFRNTEVELILDYAKLCTLMLKNEL